MHHLIDPDNAIVKLCAEGMQQEGQGNPGAAKVLSLQAWNTASNALEKLIAAHYVARHQSTAAEKLEWDILALKWAGAAEDTGVKGAFPSLQLNIAKGYEDTGDAELARYHYQQAILFAPFLQDDGYGKMIRSGIAAGLQRVQEKLIDYK